MIALSLDEFGISLDDVSRDLQRTLAAATTISDISNTHRAIQCQGEWPEAIVDYVTKQLGFEDEWLGDSCRVFAHPKKNRRRK